MAVRQVYGSELESVIEAAGFPSSLPNSGTYVEVNNNKYLLALRNGTYLAWDISVHAADGSLLSNAWDAYLNAGKEILTDVVPESASDILDIVKFAAIAFGAYYAIKILRG